MKKEVDSAVEGAKVMMMGGASDGDDGDMLTSAPGATCMCRPQGRTPLAVNSDPNSLPHTPHTPLYAHPCPTQAAQPPPDEWAWRNVYVEPQGIELRAVDGSYHESKYDPTYSS